MKTCFLFPVSKSGSPLSLLRSVLLLVAAIAASAFLTARARGAEELSATLQRGLFEEEANHDLNAAIKAYEAVVAATDAQRKLAGTALYRLAECYRKLDRTNDAVAHYQRVVREYGDQTRLADLSRQYLASTAGGALSEDSNAEHLRALERQRVDAGGELARMTARFKFMTNATRAELRRTLPTIEPDAQLLQLLREQAQDEQRLASLTNLFGKNAPDVLVVRDKLTTVSNQIEGRLDGILQGLKVRLDAEAARLERLGPATAQRLPTGPAVSVAPVIPQPLSDEDKEIRNIQALMKDSPDLVNARSQFLSGVDGSGSGVTYLHKAATLGQIKLAEFLLANGADVNAAAAGSGSVPGPTPLVLAARAGRKSLVELLLAKGAKVQGNQPYTPLHEAASKGYKSVVEALLDAGANVNAEDFNRCTPLFEAATRGYTSVAQALLTRGAQVNALCLAKSAPDGVANGGPSLQFGGSALHSACQRGDKAMVDLLLSNKANVNLRSHYGLMPIHGAVYHNHLPVIEALLAAGADVNASIWDSSRAKTNMWAPLHVAIMANLPEVARLLLEQKADPNQRFDNHRGQDGWTALHQTLGDSPKDSMAILRLLLDHKANPNLPNGTGYGPIYFCLNSDSGKAPLDLLLKNGADPNLRDPDGKTALTSWSPQWQITPREFWQILLARGADPNAQDKSGRTPLHWLASRAEQPRPGSSLEQVQKDPNSSASMAELLFEHGADANLRDVNGLNALNTLTSATADGTALIGVLTRHGAKRELLEPGSEPGTIRVWRKGRPLARTVFLSDADKHNRFTLFDTILSAYKSPIPSFPSRVPAAPQPPTPGLPVVPPRQIRNIGVSAVGMSAVFGAAPLEDLPFPDFTRVRVQRFADGAANEKKVFEYNLLDAQGQFDCTKDQLLEFGDIVILPEREFNLSEAKVGLSLPQEKSLRQCLQRRLTLVVKGERVELEPLLHTPWLAEILRLPGVRSVLRSSSDLSRLTVRRADPETRQPVEFVVDATQEGRPAENDLWLRDGDVIEVPDK